MNFCVEGIGTSITCDKVEGDGYEAKNLLIGSITSQNGHGFMADRFIGVPVTLSLSFSACIEISHIVIFPKVGRQTSSAFSITSKTSYKSWTKEQKGSGSFISSHLIAKEFINSRPVPSVIVFKNPRYVMRSPFTSLPTESSYSRFLNTNCTYRLKHPAVNACERVIGLDISIIRVADSSIPSIQSIQVWGQPCIRCPQEQKDKLLKSWLRFSSHPEITQPQVSAEQEDENHAKKPTYQNRSGTQVPDEFLDAITFELMEQPIRLPCGLAVDASTLERYYLEEEKFARLPNDPFTGISFTETFKPLLDTSLKLRIDRFLCQNCNDPKFKNIARTLSPIRSRNQVAKAHASSILNVSGEKLNPYQSFCLDGTNFCPKKTISNPLKRKFSETFLHSDTSDDVKSSLTILPIQSHETFSIECKDCSLQLDKSCSLDFYMGNCRHVFLCRKCLLKTEDRQSLKKCTTCGISWRANALIRVFV